MPITLLGLQEREVIQGLEEAASAIDQAATRRYEELFQHLPIACFGYDVDGNVVEWNRAAERLFRLGPAHFFARSIFDILCAPDQVELFSELLSEVFRENSVESFDWRLEDAAGEVKFLNCSTFPVHDNQGNICGGILACLDTTEQKTYERQIEDQLLRINEYSLEIEQSHAELAKANSILASLAATDGLTGILNHRAFEEALARDLKRSSRESQPYSIVMLDVDHFKHYNDTYGHLAGDEVLKSVAMLLGRCARGSDIVARYGGEEFVVLLPNTDREGALVLAERMRAGIEGHAWSMREVTASFGVATLDSGSSTPAELVDAADRAMYISKSSGRNKVSCLDQAV